MNHDNNKEAGRSSAGPEGDRYKTILRAAITVFASKGYHGCRISDVARQAGVAYGLVYHYFKDKEELIQSVFEVGWGGFLARVREVVESSLSLDEKIHRIVGVAFQAYRIDPDAVKVVILEIGRNLTIGQINRRPDYSEVIQICARIFEKAAQNGELPSDFDPLLGGAFLVGMIEMTLTSLVLGFVNVADDEAVNRAQQQLIDSFLQGVRRPPGQPLSTRVEKSLQSSSAQVELR